MRDLSGKAWRLIAAAMSLLVLTSFGIVSYAAPNSVTLAGSLQEELGCGGDWDPACAATHLTNVGNDVFRGEFSVPAGEWEYKMVIDDSWDNGSYPGDNKALSLGSETAVRFYYDDKTNGVVDSVNDMVAVAAGSFQDQLGCGAAWEPWCVASLLTDVDGDGVYAFVTSGLAVGSYEFKVALNEAWDTAYPADNVPFTTNSVDDVVTITWDSSTTDVTVDVSGAVEPTIEWVVAGNFQDDLPVSAACGEWNNACPETTMEDDDGDGVFRLYGDDLPAGDYEYKIVESGNWDNAYPADNVTFSADGSQMRWYFQPDTTNFADNANQCIATVAGSFQDEIGGPEWTPSNLRTMMWQEAPGSDWYSYTATLPAGTWEYKVARDEDWAESYPTDNMVLELAAETAVTFRYNCATNAVEHSTGGIEPGDAELVTSPITHPIQDDVFYFVLPDRFNNGDVSNDQGGIVGDVADHGFRPDDKAFYHGGDLAGLMDKLDYLEGLGVTAIWMTPVFENRPTQPDSSTDLGIGAAYHGYWIVDFLNTDPHLGTNEELGALIDEAHARGIKIYFDIVINHTGDVIEYEGGEAGYRNKDDFPYVDANGVAFDDRDFAGGDTFPELDPATSFPYVPTVPAGLEDYKNPAWLNDPIYYHNRGNSTFSGENSEYGDFFGLDDLFTEHPVVVDGMIDIFKTWISDYGVDGFRIDTVKHVNTEFWQQFGPEIMAHAEAEGINEFFMFGEVFDGNPAFLSEFTTDGELPSVLDFGMQGTAGSFAARSEATDNVANFFANDDYYTDADSSAYQLANFISNHDIGRFGKSVQDSNGGATDAEMVDRMLLGHALMYFSRGFPVLYYGDEQGFTGDGGDKDAREDMMPSLVDVYNDNNLIGTDATTADDNFDDTHILYQTLSDLAAVRSAYPALTTGAQIHRYSQDSAGVYAFSRVDRDEQVEFLVVLNNAESERTVSFATYTPDASFLEVYPSNTTVVNSDVNGNVTVTVPALGFMILGADQALPASDSAPGVSFTTPAAESEVSGRVELGVDVTGNQFAEVTFAVQVDGGEFEVVGVDTNAPYRVFYDTDELADGTALTIKAIVSDNSGNLNSATTTAVIGADSTGGGGGDATYAIIHYYREDGDYGDHTTGDYNDFWGLHLWGDAIDPSEVTEWTSPKPFLGEDEYGRFAWIKLADPSQPLNFIVHRGDTKDGTDADRFYNPGQNPEVWLKQGDPNNYASQAAAQGFVTIRYQRPDGDYGDYGSDDFNDFWGLHLWGDAIDPSEATDWPAPKKATGVDDYGAFWEIQIVDANQPVNFIIHRGDEKDPGPDQMMLPADSATIWLQSGDETLYLTRGAAEGFATIHYHRPDGDYGDATSSDFADFWGLHVWTGAANPTDWPDPVRPAGFDIFGPYYQVALVDGATELAYIIHRGDEKDPGPDQFLNLNVYGHEVWQQQGADPENPYILPTLFGGPGANPGNIDEQSAYWVDEQTIAWAAAEDSSLTFYLAYAAEGGLEATEAGVTGGTLIELEAGTLSAEVKEKFPHLASLPALQIPADSLALVPEILKGQIAVTAVNGEGESADATGLQIPGVLDDLYSYDGDLGVTWDGDVPTVNVWAPTAKSVTFHLFADADPATTSSTSVMSLDPTTGVWSITGDASWKNQFYLFEVEVYVHSTGQVENNVVTDPYSFSLAMNSTRSQLVDLSDPTLAPAGWDSVAKPELAAPEDITIYELHVRDFSIQDQTVPEAYRGTFKAFTVADSNGMQHIASLADAGLSHLHLLPVFDIATINENVAEQVNPSFAELAGYGPDSEEQQALITATEDQDGFNWGYDPFHYTVPEGSYSTNPDGSTRVVEFREMVQAVNETGLRLVMDVVYNHTNASGQNEKSVLDQIVPGYYHRLNDKGDVEKSTCCDNTATEHDMMEKLMIDSLVTWAVMYKVDAFRFDLMGHHMLRNMVAVREALDALTFEEHGVDGSEIYVYGEGWNFGEVANNARGVNATQQNVGGLGIGTFSDRLRDAVRGGGPFDDGETLLTQGFGNGLYTDPNSLDQPGSLDRLLLYSDQIRVGMAGNLADYELTDRFGNVVTGSQVDYNGSPAGYTLDPQEDITYVSKHDNQTLYDINVYGLPADTPMAERIRAQALSLGTVMYGQGVPFFHAGVEILRSKSLDRDSFNSGDWFNFLDYTYGTNNFGGGLPVASKNQSNWGIMGPYLADPALEAGFDNITLMNGMFEEMLAVRASSKLFRLETLTDVQERVVFHNVGPDQLPGLIVMTISDKIGTDLDPLHETVVVILNSNDEAYTFSDADLEGLNLILHPVLANSVDAVVQTTSFDSATGSVTIPGRTAAVLVEMIPVSDQLDSLVEDVKALKEAGDLRARDARKLLQRLSAAERYVDRGRFVPQAVRQMEGFVTNVKFYVRKGWLSEEAGDALVEKAELIILQLEAGG